MERLISEDEVDFIFGPYGSGLTVASSTITERNGVIMMAGGAGATSVYDRGFKYLFSPLSPVSSFTRSGLEELVAQHDVQTLGILHTDDAAMNDLSDAAELIAQEYGMEVVSRQTVPADATDISGAMTQLAQADPDVLLSAGHLVAGILSVQTMQQVGWTPDHVLMIQAPGEPDFVEQLGAETVEGILGPVNWHQDAAWEGEWMGSAKDYRDRFFEAYGEEPSYLPPGATAAALALQLGIEEAGTLETEAVHEAIQNLEVETFYGTLAFSDEDDPSGLRGKNVNRDMLTIQLKDGEQVVVAPESAAMGETIDVMVPWDER